MAGYFFERQARLPLKYRPTGKDRRRGDWSIIKPNHSPIFVEVKSPWEERGKGGPYNNTPKIRQELKAAYKQIAGNGPAMVVMIDNGFNVSLSVDRLGVADALYGPGVIMVPILVDPTTEFDGKAKFSRIRKGFFQPRQHRNLSAVGILESKLKPGEYKLNYNFQIYHNPHATYSINPEMFRKYRQFTFDHKNRRVLKIRLFTKQRI